MRKMILVPADLVPKHRPVDQQVAQLDQDMQNVLANSNVPADVTMKLYNDALTRYGLKQREAERPVAITMHHDVPLFPENFLQRIPPTKLEAAESMLSFLRATPAIKWSVKKELVIDGEAVSGSNAVDLFHHAVRDKSMANVPTGWEQFHRVLLQNNVPRIALDNRNLYPETQTRIPVRSASVRPPDRRRQPQETPDRRTQPQETPAASPHYFRHSRVVKRSPQGGKGVFKFESLY